MCMENLLRCVNNALPDWGLRKYIISKFSDLGKIQLGSKGPAMKELRDGNFHKFAGLQQRRSAIGVDSCRAMLKACIYGRTKGCGMHRVRLSTSPS